ncbi:UDP-glucosyl transferase 85A2 [Perilla frutescens var. hirtella]|nr:UDP-glucosyl transferase 85A2 [Perilla frutescens var. hirtella]
MASDLSSSSTSWSRTTLLTNSDQTYGERTPSALTGSTRRRPSVVYVNFGSITVMTPHQLTEFAWGLANTNRAFLWIIRPDLVSADRKVLPPNFVEVTRERGLIASWCPQEKVLSHPTMGGFLTRAQWMELDSRKQYAVECP